MARFAAPAGWRVLRSRSRLQAHWSSPEGRWARYSIRLEPRDAQAGGEVFFQRVIGSAQLTVTFSSGDLAPETVEAASACSRRCSTSSPAPPPEPRDGAVVAERLRLVAPA